MLINFISLPTDHNQSIRALPPPGHRVQNPLGDLGYSGAGGGLHAPGQVPHAPPGPSPVLLEHGGARASRWSAHHARAGRRRASCGTASLPPEGVLQVSLRAYPMSFKLRSFYCCVCPVLYSVL